MRGLIAPVSFVGGVILWLLPPFVLLVSVGQALAGGPAAVVGGAALAGTATGLAARDSTSIIARDRPSAPVPAGLAALHHQGVRALERGLLGAAEREVLAVAVDALGLELVTPADGDVSGDWSTSYGGMTLDQDGTEVTGSYNGSIGRIVVGVLVGNNLSTVLSYTAQMSGDAVESFSSRGGRGGDGGSSRAIVARM